MPKKIEDALKRQAARKKLSKERADAYVYGTLYKIEHPEKYPRKGKKKP